MEIHTSLIDTVKDSCNSAFKSVKISLKNVLYTQDYLFLKFRSLVFNELAEKLAEKDYTFTQVYDCFIEIYYDEFYRKLLKL